MTPSHTVRAKTQDARQFLRPDVGPLTLTHRSFDVRDAPGRQLVIYHAEPGSPSAEALNLHLLGSITPPGARPNPGPAPGEPTHMAIGGNGAPAMALERPSTSISGAPGACPADQVAGNRRRLMNADGRARPRVCGMIRRTGH
ncbi:hypothetical protein [Streptomyces sp. NL15-2K]|uniref:MmyB family transcriptional regulator n=1 Tax=Streptomyces sp. NL15-2K TaxID=376149 RepID=UPI000FFA6A19|nr:hypothetical protein SNL152K_2063 [Streptomyces sp. NL15-2K]